jgi:arylsulfatase A-like enzyme
MVERWLVPRLWGALLLILGAACAEERQSPPGAPANLVIVSLDTVRRDHLPTYGYGRYTAPALAAFAERAVVFENAFAQDTNTNPSHASMLTGLYPHAHGNVKNGSILADGVATLAQIVRDAGFDTAAFVTGATMVADATGLDRGFEVYDDDFEGKRRAGKVATKRAAGWLGDRGSGKRAFLLLHLFDAHGPYLPKGAYETLFLSRDPGERVDLIPPYQQQLDEQGIPHRHLNWYVDRYDAMIRYVDDCLRDLLKQIDLDDTVVVVIADHGETLGERELKLDHGGRVFDEQIRIPLVIRVPGLAPRRESALVETVDLLPTLLALLRVPTPEGLRVQGRSLLPLLVGSGEADAKEAIYASARAAAVRQGDRRYVLDRERRITSVRSRRWKLIRYPSIPEDYLELYDLAADPDETEDVAERFPEVRDAYLRALEEWHADARETAAPSRLSPELRERLRALGYAD